MTKAAARVTPHCPIHPLVAMVCPACTAGRNKGVTSKAKARASARNGRLGGRPKLPPHSTKCDLRELPYGARMDIHAKTERYAKGCPRCRHDYDGLIGQMEAQSPTIR